MRKVRKVAQDDSCSITTKASLNAYAIGRIRRLQHHQVVILHIVGNGLQEGCDSSGSTAHHSFFPPLSLTIIIVRALHYAACLA